jgi:transcriptional regulator with XRE-family HTH domain
MELVDRVNQVEEWRTRSEMSYQELARQSGVDVKTVWMILNGKAKSPSYESLEALAAVFSTQSDGGSDL